MNTSIGRTTASPPVLVAVDGSSNSHAALTWAAHEARSRHARLRIVHACPAPAVWDPAVLAHLAPEHAVVPRAGLTRSRLGRGTRELDDPRPRGRPSAAPGQPGAGHPRREQAGEPDRPGPRSGGTPIADRGCHRAMQFTGERGRHRRPQASVQWSPPNRVVAVLQPGQDASTVHARARRGPHPGASACLAADRHGGLVPRVGGRDGQGPPTDPSTPGRSGRRRDLLASRPRMCVARLMLLAGDGRAGS